MYGLYSFIKGSQGRTSRRSIRAGTEAEGVEEGCFWLVPQDLFSLLSYGSQDHPPSGGTS